MLDQDVAQTPQTPVVHLACGKEKSTSSVQIRKIGGSVALNYGDNTTTANSSPYVYGEQKIAGLAEILTKPITKTNAALDSSLVAEGRDLLLPCP